MENALKGLMIASGVVITCIIISLGFFITNRAKEAADNGINQISMLSKVTDVTKEMYDGLRVTGAEVVDLIDESEQELEDGSLIINVITGLEAEEKRAFRFNSELSRVETALDYSSANYINPNGTFKAEVETDAKGMITMTFRQV